jgi:hypothetical protein
MKVKTRNGYAKNGSGEEIGDNWPPEKIVMDTIANSTEATMPTSSSLKNTLSL